MRSTKEKRDRLFKDSRPFIRPFDPKTDFWVLWAAYDLGSFPSFKKDIPKEAFAQFVIRFVQSHSSCLVIEDDCKWFKAKRGPVALVTVDNFGWRVEPVVDWFKWASPRMKLRCAVAFFQKTRYASEVGVCEVRVPEKGLALYEHLREYGVLFPCGKVPNGSEKGDVHLFYIGGKRATAHGTRSPNPVQRNDHVGRAADSSPERHGAVAERTDVESGQERPADPAETKSATTVAAPSEPESRRLRTGWGDGLPAGAGTYLDRVAA